MRYSWEIIVSTESPNGKKLLVYSIVPSEEEKKRAMKPHLFGQKIGDDITEIAVEYNLPFEIVTEFLKKAEKHRNKHVSIILTEK